MLTRRHLGEIHVVSIGLTDLLNLTHVEEGVQHVNGEIVSVSAKLDAVHGAAFLRLLAARHIEDCISSRDEFPVEVSGEKGVFMSGRTCGFHFALCRAQVCMGRSHVKGQSRLAEHAFDVVFGIKVLGSEVSVAVRTVLNPVGELRIVLFEDFSSDETRLSVGWTW